MEVVTYICPLGLDWIFVVCYWWISCEWQVVPPSRQWRHHQRREVMTLQ